jgi:hypothetical protein
MVLISCWSVKGGSGTTVVASALALVLARSSAAGSLLVDLAGDVPAAAGVADPGDPGLTGWVAAGAAVPADGLARLELDLGDGVSLLPRGRGGFGGGPERLEALAGLLASDRRAVVADCGVLDADAPALPVAAIATQSLLVVRPCYLALRRVAAAPLRPSGVVLVTEPGRALHRADVENVVGAPVRAEVLVDPAVARAVDAGVLASRMPRGLERALRSLALPLAA